MGTIASETVTVIEPRLPGLRERLRELIAYRRLMPYFAGRALEKTYARTKLGVPWLVVRPLGDTATRAFVFGSVLNAPSAAGAPYFLFFLVGMSAWHLFDRSLLWSTRSLELNRRLLTKLYFPRLVLPFAGVAPALVEFGVYLVLIAGTLGYFAISDGHLYLAAAPRLLTALAGYLIAAGLAIGLGLWTSVLGANARDVRFSLRYVTEAWFFLTPVIYPLSALPHVARELVWFNPMTPAVELVKWGVIGAGTVHVGPLVASLAVIVAIWTGGLRFFGRAESAAVDRL